MMKRVAILVAFACAGVARADFTVSENLTLTADETWQYRGKMTLGEGVTLDLAGHSLWVAELAGAGTITNSSDETTADLHVFVPNNATYGNTSVSIGGNLRLVKEGKGIFTPTKTGQTYTGGTVVAAGTMKAWLSHYPQVAASVTVCTNAFFDIDGAAANNRNGTLGAGHWYVLAGGTLTNGGTDIGSGWCQLDHVRLTADSSLTSAFSWGLIGGSYSATDLDLAGKTLTVTIPSTKHFYLWNANVTAGTLATTGDGTLNIDKTSLRAEQATLDLGTPVQLTAGGTVGTLIVRTTGTTGAGNAVLQVKNRFQPVSDYIYNFKLLDGATLDLTARSSAYSLVTADAAKTLAFAANATITIDVSGRVLANNETIVSWSATPNDVTFVLDAESARAYDLVSTATGLSVTHKADYPVTACWTGRGNASDPTDPANWACTNAADEAIASYPCPLTTIILSAAETMRVPQGTTLCCQALAAPQGAALAADADWRGLVAPRLTARLDLQGHKLYVTDLLGNGTITDTSADTTAPGELHVDVPAGRTAGNTDVTLSGNLQLVKDGAGTFVPTALVTGTSYTGGTRVSAGLMKARGNRCTAPVQVDAGAHFDYDPFVNSSANIWNSGAGPFVLNGGDVYQSWQDMSTGWGQIASIRLTADSSFTPRFTTGLIASGYNEATLDLGGYTLDADLGTVGCGIKFLQCCNVTATKGTLRVGETTSVYFFNKPSRFTDATIDTAGLLEITQPVTVSNLIVRTVSASAWGNSTMTICGSFTPVSDWLHNFTLASGATLDLNRRYDPFCLTSPLTGKTLGFAAGAAITVDVHARTCPNGTQLVAWTAEPTDITFAIDAESAARGGRIVSTSQGIYVSFVGEVAEATWTGAVDMDFAKSGNWICTDADGEVVPDALPNSGTFVRLPGELAFAVLTTDSFPHALVQIDNATLTADADWSGFGEDLVFAGTLDLAGHKLTVSSLSGAGTITDTTTDTAAPGELHLVVPADTTRGNALLTLAGNLTFVKDGPGTFTPTKKDQSYTGGTVVAGGTMKAWTTHYPAETGLRIDTGATLDIDGANTIERTAYYTTGYTLNGGTLVNQTSDIGWAALPRVTLTDDSTIRAVYNLWMLGGGYAETFLTLNDHTLTVDIASGKFFGFGNCTMKSGTIRATGAGELRLFNTNRTDGVSLDLGTPLWIEKYGSVTLKDLTVRYNGTAGRYTDGEVIDVTGVYAPLTDYIFHFRLLDGATIDLRERTGAWPVTSALTKQTLAISAGAHIGLNLAGRADLTNGLRVVACSTEEVPASVRFKVDDATALKYLAVRRTDGVELLTASFLIIIR